MRLSVVCLVCLLLLAFTCEQEILISDDERIFFSGRLTDSQGNPFVGIPVQVYATTDFDFRLEQAINQEYGSLIASSTTNDDGLIRMTGLRPLNASNLYALINFSGIGSFEIAHAPLIINRIKEDPSETGLYSLGNLVLDTKETLRFNAVRERNQSDTLAYHLEFSRGIKIIDTNSIDEFFDFETRQSRFARLLPSQSERVFQINTIESDTVLLRYQLLNNGITDEGEQEIIVKQLNGSYEFVF